MNLAIDIGNTRVKCAVFEEVELLEKFVFELINFDSEIKNILKRYEKIAQITISSVGKTDNLDFDSLFEGYQVHLINHKTHFPFENLYETPHTLGIDRMVLSAGATILYPTIAKMVIDVGTCITYDYINDQNQYLGGAISPGFRLRYESLHYNTAKLPLLTLENPENEIGKSTKNAIHSGVVNGIVHEIDGFVNDFKNCNQNFIIILTGGDTFFLANKLKNSIFANSNFLLESLNLIYIYNKKND